MNYSKKSTSRKQKALKSKKRKMGKKAERCLSEDAVSAVYSIRSCRRVRRNWNCQGSH